MLCTMMQTDNYKKYTIACKHPNSTSSTFRAELIYLKLTSIKVIVISNGLHPPYYGLYVGEQ